MTYVVEPNYVAAVAVGVLIVLIVRRMQRVGLGNATHSVITSFLTLAAAWAVIVLLNAWEKQEIDRLFGSGAGAYDHSRRYASLRISLAWITVAGTIYSWTVFFSKRKDHPAFRVAVWMIGIWLCIFVLAASQVGSIPG